MKKEYKKKETVAVPTLSAFTYNQSDPEVAAFINKLQKHDISNSTKK